MDISAFEATASGGGDEPQPKDVLLLVDDDLQVPIKAVIAVVKHVGRLFVFVVALGMCVTIYCFTVSWICLFWLQTRMLFVTSSLLHRCLDEPIAPKHQWVDLNKPVETLKTQNETESPPPKPRSAWASQPRPASSNEGISLGAKSPEDTRSHFSSGIELPEHMRPSSSGSVSPKQQPSRRDSFVPSDNHDGVGDDILDRLLQREREIEAERSASPVPQHDALEQDTTADEQPAEEIEQQPLQVDVDEISEAELDTDAGASSIVADHVNDDVNSSEAVASNSFGFTAEQMAEAARFAAEATKGGDKKKNRPVPPSHLSHRAVGPPQRKLSKEEQKVQAQSNWMSSMTSGKSKENAARVQKSGPPSSEPIANKPPVPAAAQQKAAQMPLKQTTNGTTPKWSEMAAILGQDDKTPAPSPMTSAAASPAGMSSTKMPPHVRKSLEAKAKKAAEEASAKALQQAQAAAVAAAMAQAHPAKAAAAEQEETMPADEPRPLEDAQPASEAPLGSPAHVEQSLDKARIVEETEKSQAEEQTEGHIVPEEPVGPEEHAHESDGAPPQTPLPSNIVPEAEQTDDEIKDKKDLALTIGDKSGYQEWSQQYAQRSEPYSPYNQRLEFYEETPELKQPAPRSMSADMLKDMNTTPVHMQSTGHNIQCEGCHRWFVAAEGSKLCTTCSTVHDRMQDDRHAVFGDLLTRPPLKVDAVEFKDIEEPEEAMTCENCGMHDHEASDCGICLECDRSDGEPCSRHPKPTALGNIEKIDHGPDASSDMLPADPEATTADAVSAAPQLDVATVGSSKDNDTPVPSSRREATPADLIQLKSSGEPRPSTSLAPEVQKKTSPWRPRAPSFFVPTSKPSTDDFDHAADSSFRAYGSLPHVGSASHARPIADPFAAGPFQTDWWSNHQAAMGPQPSAGYGIASASPSSFQPPVPPQQLYGMNTFTGPHCPRLLYAHKLQPETLTDRAIRMDTLAPKPIVPPGLGGPQAGRQASFDALLAPNDVSKPQQRSGYDQEISKAQLKMRQLAGLKQSDTPTKMKDSATVADLNDFSTTFNLPEAFARNIVDPSSSRSADIEIKVEDTEHNVEVPSDGPATVAHGNQANASVVAASEAQNVTSEETLPMVPDSAQDLENTQNDPEAEKAREAKKLVNKLRSARDTQEKQNGGAILIPDELAKLSKINDYVKQLDDLGFDENGEKKITSADTGDSSGPDDAKSAKQALREQKKATREAVKIAWLERDIARAKVIGTWTIENANKLKTATAAYHARRAELASLMADGKLHDDDARVYPVFADIDLSEPKSKPEGTAQLRRRIKEQQSSSSSSEDEAKAASAVEPPAGDAKMQKAKAKLLSARTLRQQALDHFKQPQPQTNIRYDDWKDKGDKRLARANAFYKKKREELIAFFPNTGLPADLEAEFPDIL